MKVLTPPNYDEVHHRLLECYSIQPMRVGTLEEKFTNDVKTTKIVRIITQVLTKGDDFERSAPHPYLSKNSYVNTICDYEINKTINDNTYDK